MKRSFAILASIAVLETASPPTFYIPLADIATEYLERAPGSSSCEWKGTARYWTVSVPPVVLTAVGWSYADPPPDLDAIRDHLSFYPDASSATSTASGCCHKRGASTAAGSHRRSSGPSRETRARADGDAEPPS